MNVVVKMLLIATQHTISITIVCQLFIDIDMVLDVIIADCYCLHCTASFQCAKMIINNKRDYYDGRET